MHRTDKKNEVSVGRNPKIRTIGPNSFKPYLEIEVGKGDEIEVAQAVSLLAESIQQNVVKPDLCVIRGNEPMDQTWWLDLFITEGWLTGLFKEIEIETRGDFAPGPLENQRYISFFVVNIINHTMRDYKPETFRAFNHTGRAKFGFIIYRKADMVEVRTVVSDCYLKPENVLIIANTEDKLQITIIRNECLKHGFSFQVSQH